MQFGYFLLCGLNAILNVFKKKNVNLEGFCNLMYTSLIFPIGAVRYNYPLNKQMKA